MGKALGVVAPDNYQMGWASYDLDYEDRKIEVKSSARGQSWHQNRPSAVSWGIAPSRSQWDHSMEEETLASIRRREWQMSTCSAAMRRIRCPMGTMASTSV